MMIFKNVLNFHDRDIYPINDESGVNHDPFKLLFATK